MTISPTKFETLVDNSEGMFMPLPVNLENIYGKLRFPVSIKKPYVISNFVSTLDGVVTLNVPGHSGGGDISGFNSNDQFLMGLLRAAADAVIVGASQLRQPPGTIWIPESIYPSMKNEYRNFRLKMGKNGNPLQVILTASGNIDLKLPIFQSEEIPILILTNQEGEMILRKQSLPSWVEVVAMKDEGRLSATRVISEIQKIHPAELLLVEGGPNLVRYFFEEKCLDELFLTLAPQVAGRDSRIERLGFVKGKIFAPEDPRWGTLMDVKKAGSHLFFRYGFPRTS